MRRFVVAGVLIGVGVVIARGRLGKLREQVMAHCEGMFERMPDTFPPKRMLRGIEEIRVSTARIRDLLEGSAAEVSEPRVAGGSDVEEVHDAA